jgi:crotonobetainyl-CoA:carnitine CoA-transferase CaiB-like acyl-CoA transferase
MNTVANFLEHPQLSSRDRWREIGSPAGPLSALRPPVDIDGVDPAMGAVPALGEHTAAILAELGVAPDTIAAWRREGTI